MSPESNGFKMLFPPTEWRQRLRLVLAALLLAASPLTAAGEVRILVQSSPLAGFQYHAGSIHWDKMREGDRLQLVREAGNPHDVNAVRVEWHGEMLGYLPRRENAAVASAMDAGETIGARIEKLREHKNPWQRVLIDLSRTQFC
jgi:hypothetical protein